MYDIDISTGVLYLFQRVSVSDAEYYLDLFGFTQSQIDEYLILGWSILNFAWWFIFIVFVRICIMFYKRFKRGDWLW